MMRKNRAEYGLIFVLCLVVFCGCANHAERPSLQAAVPGERLALQRITDAWEHLTVNVEQRAAEYKKAKQEAKKKESERMQKGILVALDPGHQGPEVDMSAQEANAPGSSVMKRKATGGTSGRFSGIPEYQLNLDISLMVRDKLSEQGYDVLMTRQDHLTAISNAERAVLANESGADIAVRIHANGSDDSAANGALALIGSAQNPYVGALYDESHRLAETVLQEYCAATGMQNLGVQLNDTMTGINWSQIPVIILEMGFMTNRQDDLNMADEKYRQKMAEGIVNGINAYYGF